MYQRESAHEFHCTASAQMRRYLPRLSISVVVAVVAMFLAEHHGAPVMLLALQLGVALLGLRITLDQVRDLGWQPIAMVVLAVAPTIVYGIVLARYMDFQMFFGQLTGSAMAICGASAALIISDATPQHPRKEQATLFTVIRVSTLSTLALMPYPMFTGGLDVDAWQAGDFTGSTIHEAAQGVGAGSSISKGAGDVATLVKLTQVAMLLPVIALAAWLARRYKRNQDSSTSGPRPPLLPWFAVPFAVLVTNHSTGWLPPGWWRPARAPRRAACSVRWPPSA